MLAYGAAGSCALALGAVGYAPGLFAFRPPASARVRIESDQTLRLSVDGMAAVPVPPGEVRALPAGRHSLVFTWPSGARDAEAFELAAGELRVVRPVLPPTGEGPAAPPLP